MSQTMTDNPHYVTAEEAQEVGCVMSMGRQNPSIVYQTCLGPKCMAWRWRPKGHQDLMQGAMLQLPLVPEEPMTHGYCGMVRS
jgi:hypothetical protein